MAVAYPAAQPKYRAQPIVLPESRIKPVQRQPPSHLEILKVISGPPQAGKAAVSKLPKEAKVAASSNMEASDRTQNYKDSRSLLSGGTHL